MTRRLLLLATLALGVGSTGCTSYMTLGGTRTVTPGKVQMTGSVGKMIPEISSVPNSTQNFATRYTSTEGMLRVGIAPGLDWGLRLDLWALALSTDVKYRFLTTEKMGLAAYAGAGIMLWATIVSALGDLFPNQPVQGSYYFFDTGLLFGYYINPQLELVLGGKAKITTYGVQAQLEALDPDAGSVSVGGTFVQPGVVFGVEWSMDDRTRIFPELDIHYDPASRSLLVQGGLSVSFGG